MAATKKVRNCAVLINGRRQATMQNVTFTYNTNDTQEVADSGVYVAEGRGLSTVQSTNIVPVAGTTTKLLKKALRKEKVNLVLWPIDGDIVTLEDCGISSLEFSSEAASGRQNGTFNFFAADPEVQG